MVIEQIYTGNAYRNFHYLIACADTGEALAVDPLEADLVLAHAAGKGWRITQVLNTHEHADHTGGNARLIAATGPGFWPTRAQRHASRVSTAVSRPAM